MSGINAVIGNRVAVFIDFENIKISVDASFENERVDLRMILERIAAESDARILVKRAYADWGIFRDYRSDLLDNATEPVQTFALTYKGKNGADIRIACDVMEFVLRHPDLTHVALVSGDSDFTPLVMKLREFGLQVVGVGVRNNTSAYLAKSCDKFLYYDEFRNADDPLPDALSPGTDEVDPKFLLLTALAQLGNRSVTGSLLKTRMRQIDPRFDETRHGHASFMDFIRSAQELIDVFKPAVGDFTVAPKGMLAAPVTAPQVSDSGMPGGYIPYVPDSGIPYHAPLPIPAPVTAAEKYRIWLRDNNFRHVPAGERRDVIRATFDIFTAATGPISLKEAKDRLHAWFEENKPSVPWESINSAVYHLFYTWCFRFDKTDEGEGKQLWDRRTSLQEDILSADALQEKCERGIVRRLWERERDDLDPVAVNAWLYDGDEVTVPRVRELIEVVAAPTYVPGSRF